MIGVADASDHGDFKREDDLAEVMARSTSIDNKCKGKYRIKVKGAACHGRGCCGGT